MNILKRMVALVLTFAMLLTCAGVAAPAEAAETHQHDLEKKTAVVTDVEPMQVEEGVHRFSGRNPLYEGIIDDDGQITAGSKLTLADAALLNEGEYLSVSEAIDFLREQMVNRNNVITLYLASTNSDFNAIFDEVFYGAMAHTGVPEEGDSLAWVWKEYGGQYSIGVSGNQYLYTFVMEIEYYTTYAQELQVDQAVDSLLAQLNLWNASDYEKVCGVYDWLCDNVTYDYANLNAQPYYYLMHTAYAAIIDRTAVCQGYAVLMYRLLLELDVDVRVITGDGGGPHAWNIVNLNGWYYNCDSTWDAGTYSYSWFLRGSTTFPDHIRDPEYTTSQFNQDFPTNTASYDPNNPAVRDPSEDPDPTPDPTPGDYVLQGQCGPNAWGTLYYDGTLEITGTGATYGYADTSSPWENIADQITKIVIADGITHLGDFLFWRAIYASEVQIPASVTSFGAGVFEYCSSLANVTLPENLTTMDNAVFWGCTSLNYITIPASVTYIGDCTFYECTGLTSVYFEGSAPTFDGEDIFLNVVATAYYPAGDATWTSSVRQNYSGSITWEPYGDSGSDEYVLREQCGPNAWGTLYDDGTLEITGTGSTYDYSYENRCPWNYAVDQVTTVVIDDGITYLGSYLIYYHENLTRVQMADSVTGMGEYVFTGCSALEEVHISDSLTILGRGAFSNCHSLISATVPASVTQVKEFAFCNCYALEYVYFTGNAPTFTGTGIFQEVNTTAYYPANDATWTASVRQNYGGTITWEPYGDSGSDEYILREQIGDNAWGTLYHDGTLEITGTGATYDLDFPWADIADQITSVVIEDGITYLGYDIFSGARNLTEVQIPDSVTEIGSYAFAYCWALNDVVLPDTLTTVGYASFHNCFALEEITIPASVTVVGDVAFWGCDALHSIFFEGNAPAFGGESVFDGVTATAYYPIGNSTWTDNVRQNYGGNITWLPNGTVQSVELVSLPDMLYYVVGEVLNLDGIQIQVSYSDGSSATLTEDSLVVTYCDLSQVGVSTVELDFAGERIYFDVYVHASRETEVLDAADYPESSHNYGTYLDDIQTVTYPGAVSLTLEFSNETYVENSYDSLEIYDKYDNLLYRFTGSEAAGLTVTVPGDTAKIRLLTDGSVTYYGYSFNRITANMDVIHEGEETGTPATCTEDGYSGMVCEICGYQSEGTVIPALGHSFTNYVSDNNATCTEDGTKTAQCDRCDATDTVTDTGSALGHSFTNYVSDNNATCTEDGTKTAQCDRCDVTDTVADPGSAKGHDHSQGWSYDEVDHWKVCATCGEISNRAVHSFNGNTCTVCGYVQEEAECSHTYGEWNFDDEIHWQICTKCGEAGNAGPHTFSGSACSVCGYMPEVQIVQHPFSDATWEMLKLVNKARVANGIRPVTIFEDLQAVADIRANDLITLFSGERPNGDSGFSLLDTYGVDHENASENIARGYEAPDVLMEGLLDYADTCETILDSSFMHMGAGYAYSASTSHQHYWVQMFVYHNQERYTALELVFPNGTEFEVGTTLDEMGIFAVLTNSIYGTCYMPITEEFCTGYQASRNSDQTVTASVLGFAQDFTITRPSSCNHSYGFEITEATCTAYGYTTYICTLCGDSYVDDYVDALGHDHSARWTTDRQEHWKICGRCGQTVDRGAHTFSGSTCTVCGYSNQGQELFAIQGANMKLGGELEIFFYVLKSDLNGTGYYAEITKTYADGREDLVRRIPFEQWEDYNRSMFRFSLAGISAKEMADEILVTVYHNNGTPASRTRSDSIRDYALRALASSANSIYAKRMMVDMLNYGAAAQQIFGYGVDDLANNQLTAEQADLATGSVSLADHRIKGDNYVGTSLSLKSSIVLTMYFQNISPQMTAEVTYTNHYGELKTSIITGDKFYHRSGTTYGVDITGLVVADGRQTVMVKILDTNGNVIAKAVDSVESYVARMSSSDAIYEMAMKFVESTYQYLHS